MGHMDMSQPFLVIYVAEILINRCKKKIDQSILLNDSLMIEVFILIQCIYYIVILILKTTLLHS